MALKKYTIYSTPVCHYCHLLKNWLTENNVPFVEKDVGGDLLARQEMVAKSHQMGVPVSVIELDGGDGKTKEEIVTGFDQMKLSRLLNL